MHTACVYYLNSVPVLRMTLTPPSYYNLVTNYANPLALLRGPVWCALHLDTTHQFTDAVLLQVIEGTMLWITPF